jgi:transposase-like protein
MATIDQVRRDIARRLDEIERERDQLVNALQALGGEGSSAGGPKRRGPGRPPGSGGGRRGPKPGAKRAPRGQRRQQVLDALKEQDLGPSAIAREVGVNPTQISGLLRQLASAGKVSRTAEGKWTLADGAPAATSPNGDATTAPEGS